MDVIKKSGSWFSYNGERLGQGKDNVRKLVEADPALLAELEEKVRAISAERALEEAPGEFELDDEDDDELFEIESMDVDDE